MLTVLLTSAGMFTTFPFILNWFPLGAWRSFWKANLGANILHSNSFKSKKSGFAGKDIPFLAAQGGILSFFKCLYQDWQMHSIPPTLVLVSKYFSAVGLVSLSFSAVITLCLYHNWLQQEQMYSGPLETLACNFLISPVMVGLYTFFSFWYWCWFVSLSCLWSADSFAIFSFWYWHWFNSLSSLHSADLIIYLHKIIIITTLHTATQLI